ncbi:MAG TPA: LptF/LptG family permease [Bacteroidales bacterium]|nr:LptF/LptG family permease [Bacteroidales bacterium]
MKKLDLFVLRSFLGPLVLTFFIVLIILILQFLWMYVDELAGKGLEIKVLAELIYNFALTFVPMALPLAILLASLMTFGNMGEFSELTALKASGIPLQRIMRPVMILLVFISVISFFFSNNVLPYATDKARTLLWDIRRKKPDINIQAGTFYNGIPDYSIKVTRKDPVTNKMEDLIIYDHSSDRGNVSVTTADSGFMKLTPDESGLLMTLYNGNTFVELEEDKPGQNFRTFPSRKDHFEVQTFVIPLTGFDLERSEDGIFKTRAETQNISQLTYYIDSLNKEYTSKVEYQLADFNATRLMIQKSSYYYRNKIPKADSTSQILHFDPVKILDSIDVIERRSALSMSIENLKDAAAYLSLKTESLYYDIKAIKRYEVEWNKKLTMSFACLVFFFIGAPLGAIIRKGGLGTPAVISIFFFVIYYVISISAQKLVEENLVSTFAGMWAASYILLPIGIFLTYKATTDSVILNIDTYLIFFKKIKDWFNGLFMNGVKKEALTEKND